MLQGPSPAEGSVDSIQCHRQDKGSGLTEASSHRPGVQPGQALTECLIHLLVPDLLCPPDRESRLL